MSGRTYSNRRLRTELLRVRMTPGERASVAARAAGCGLTMAAYLRRVATGEGARTLDADRIVRAVNRIGTNVNQLAKVANASGHLPEAAELVRIRRELEAVLFGA